MRIKLLGQQLNQISVVENRPLYQKRVIETAKGQLGVKDHRQIVDWYNAYCYNLVQQARRYHPTYEDSWCAIFVSVCAVVAGAPKHSFPYECSVFQQREIALRSNDFLRPEYALTGDITTGDLVVYGLKTGRSPDHVGLVMDIVGDNLTTIEGNYSKTVGIRKIKTWHKSILGYIRIPLI